MASESIAHEAEWAVDSEPIRAQETVKYSWIFYLDFHTDPYMFMAILRITHYETTCILF